MDNDKDYQPAVRAVNKIVITNNQKSKLKVNKEIKPLNIKDND